MTDREVVAADQLLQLLEPRLDDAARARVVLLGLVHGLGDEPFDDARQRAVLPGLRTGVPHQLGVEPARLPAGRGEPPARVEVGVQRDQLALRGDRAHEVEEEGLPRAVVADDEPRRGAAVGDPVDVGEQRLDFARPADLDQVLPGSRHDTRAQRLDQGVALARLDLAAASGHAHISW